MVVGAAAGESPDGLHEVIAQRAAGTAVGQFHEAVFTPGQVALAGDEGGVDVDLGEVVDDDSDAASVAVREHRIEQGCLTGAEEPGQDGHRGATACGGSYRLHHPSVVEDNDPVCTVGLVTVVCGDDDRGTGPPLLADGRVDHGDGGGVHGRQGFVEQQ